MCASGNELLIRSEISGIRNVYVSGTDTLQAASITTKLVRINDTSSSINSRAVLVIIGPNDYSYNAKCSFGDECNIYCKSNTSCLTMILVCNMVYVILIVVIFHQFGIQHIINVHKIFLVMVVGILPISMVFQHKIQQIYQQVYQQEIQFQDKQQ